ncbi:hypothetical protein GTP46_25420 [Duganella sp. FT135W]|uniref:Uncharacterized protein n=1 Tax=Duganella flavida TaxID=2692175 RepID=A0A6L8KJG2_9BURK|nr:hypothetical protein [Duganella flavida]MYM25974.1 hypothetical protein [Duganella flavida]
MPKRSSVVSNNIIVFACLPAVFAMAYEPYAEIGGTASDKLTGAQSDNDRFGTVQRKV